MHRCIKPSFADRFFMTSKWCLVLVGLLIASLPHTEASADAVCVEADLLVTGQRIYTANPKAPTAETVAILGDRITFVGTESQSKQALCASVPTIDLGQSIIFPGFTDAHQHLEGVGRRTKTLSLLESIPSRALSGLLSNGQRPYPKMSGF